MGAQDGNGAPLPFIHRARNRYAARRYEQNEPSRISASRSTDVYFVLISSAPGERFVFDRSRKLGNDSHPRRDTPEGDYEPRPCANLTGGILYLNQILSGGHRVVVPDDRCFV